MSGDVLIRQLGAAEIARHRLSVPGSPSICDEHYPHHPGGNGPRQPRPRPRTGAEAAFLKFLATFVTKSLHEQAPAPRHTSTCW
jgi:hypothetical protein